MNHPTYWEFAPFDVNGTEYPTQEIANRIANWSMHFFSERHIKSKQVPPFHRDIYFDLASDFKFIVITAPSGFSKTTICSVIYVLYRNIYYHEPYTVICSRTDDASMELLDEIKLELRENDLLGEVYGSLLPTTADERGAERYKKKDSAHLCELTYADGTTTAIRSIPMRGQVRSRKRGGYRITLFIIDDPEEVDDIDSPTILEKNMRWLDRTAVLRLDKDFGKMRVVGTRIGFACTVDKLLKRKKWTQRNYKALVPDNIPIEKRKSIWEARWPTAMLHKEREEYMEEGRLADWMWERMNEPPVHLQKSLSGYQFYRGEFERKNEQNLVHLDGFLEPIPVYTYHTIDPAFSQAASADERAQITFAQGYVPMDNWQKPVIFVLEYDFDFKDPDILIERALDLHRLYHYRGLMVEANGAQRIYEFLGLKQMAKDPFLLQYPLTLNPITYQPRNKEDRIYQYFRNINKTKQFYIRPDMPELQLELDAFLNAPHLHLLDALEMGARYAIPCRDPLFLLNPKSKRYKQFYGKDDDLRDKLVEQGKDYLLY